jgi:class 3 adenylate cyclase
VAVRAITTAVLFSSIIAYLRWLPRWFDVRLGQADAAAAANDGIPYAALAVAAIVVALFATAAWWSLGALVLLRRSGDLLGNVLVVTTFAVGIIATDFLLILPMQRTDSWAAFQVPVMYLANAFVGPVLYVFPDGRLVPRIALVPLVGWALWNLIRVFVPSFDDSPIRGFVSLSLSIPMYAALFYRYLRRSDAAQQQQLKLLVLGEVLNLAGYLVVFSIPSMFPQVSAPLYRSVSSIVFSLAGITTAGLIALAIFRQSLLDIDLILSRTLVYSTVTALLVAGIALANPLVDQILIAFAGRSSSAAPILTALLAAVLFVPLRKAGIRIADRFTSGRRVLTVLFVDIVASTELAVRVGDRQWRETLSRFRDKVRAELRRYGGEEVDTAGDAFFATFPAPVRAVRCAEAIVHAVGDDDIRVRVGIHIGEVEVYGLQVTGVAVHVGARLMSLAGAGEVLVSEALGQVVAGSNIVLNDRGSHELKGVPGRVGVFAVAPSILGPS